DALHPHRVTDEDSSLETGILDDLDDVGGNATHRNVLDRDVTRTATGDARQTRLSVTARVEEHGGMPGVDHRRSDALPVRIRARPSVHEQHRDMRTTCAHHRVGELRS